MKNKGFTLIELLAVIVILAIIAVITVPIIQGVVSKVKKGSAEASALGYIDAVEKQIAINIIKNENLINDDTYELPLDSVYGLKIKGSAPVSGTLTILKNKVTTAEMCISGYTVQYENNKAKAIKKCNEENISLDASNIEYKNGKNVAQALDELRESIN